MSVEWCSNCEKNIDTDFIDGIYYEGIFICSDCLSNDDELEDETSE